MSPCRLYSALKLNDARTVRRVAAAATFKLYDGDLEGCVKVSHFHFIFRDLVEKKFISSRVSFDSVVDLLDAQGDGYIGLNKFIAWLDTVSTVPVEHPEDLSYLLV